MNKKNKNKLISSKNQRGATAVIVAVVLIILIGVGALAVDLGYAYFQRVNLQKAVDAGALAGGRVLYQENGTIIKPLDVINDAELIVQANVNGNYLVNVQIGHWSFGMDNGEKKFTNFDDWNGVDEDIVPSIDLTQNTMEDLDNNTDHINAVRVEAELIAPSFFSRIWNSDGILVKVDAVAYLGFAGTLDSFEVDMPIVICGESIKWGTEGGVNCGIGRLIHSGQSSGNSDFNTGAWTNYSSGCTINFNTSNNPPAGLQYILNAMEYPDCTAPNENPINYNVGISTGGGQSDVGFSEVGECTRFAGFLKNNDPNPPRDIPWKVTLLVVDCEGANNPSGCLNVLGAVEMSIVLITDTFPSAENKQYDHVPFTMGDPREETDPKYKGLFQTSTTDGFERWKEFVDWFDLEVLNQTTNQHDPAYNHYYQKTIYAMPDCKPVEPKGLSGGQNFGIMAKVPVLVK
jgi:hypothetical protein